MNNRNFIIRETKNFDELREIEKLQGIIFGYQKTQAIGANEMRTFEKNGGIILIAFDNPVDKAIGFLIGCVGFLDGEIYHHSLLLGVLPEYRSLGIGFGLKSKQIECVKMQGIEHITSYIDPLEGSISKLVFGKLGGRAIKYSQNLFGLYLSGVDKGLATDRLVVRSSIKNQGINSPPSKNLDLENLSNKSELVNITISRNGFREIVSSKLNLDYQRLLVEVPYDIQKIKSADINLAQDWRLKIRNILGTYLSQKFVITDFLSSRETETRNFFVLELSE